MFSVVDENACPTGFFCQFSAKLTQFQCCGQSGGCPARRAAFIAIDGNAQECIPGPDMCADGFECVRSAYIGKNICCSKEDNECGENEKMIDGRCVLLIKVGDACNKNEECGGGSKCTNGSCTCASGENVVNGECIAQTCEPNQIILNEATKSRPKNADVCPLPSEQVYYEEETSKMRYCSQISNDCPKDYSCQYSEVVKQNVCCGAGDKIEEEDQKPKSTKTRGSASSNSSHCPSTMTPYLLNGKPKSCSSSTCPYGFECKFSSANKDYFCCSKVWKRNNHLKKGLRFESFLKG
ncbi:unnamed protein product [Strongylus vulgaris]|uniref:EB domain-containing protein n=1 Tax=Strongylus vulgaris TaxID=40348 RepID=A0A3P7L8W8_STRVU|nr:unnamed protein product [Strongylus vulgaris]